MRARKAQRYRETEKEEWGGGGGRQRERRYTEKGGKRHTLKDVGIETELRTKRHERETEKENRDGKK